MKNLYCGVWSFQTPTSGICAFALRGGKWERLGVYGTEIPAQSILAIGGDTLLAVSERRDGGAVVRYRLGENGEPYFKIAMPWIGSIHGSDNFYYSQPRHMVFHPRGGWLYLLTESGNRVYVYRLANDALTELAAYSTLDPDKRAEGMAADIAVSPDGAFLYATNRSQNNIAVWRVLPGGLLDSVGWYDCGGEGPRGIAVSPDGGTLFCANNDSGAVAVLPLNPATGAPGRPVRTLEVPAAACVRVR